MEAMIERVTIRTQSLQGVGLRQQPTHEVILNPFFREFAQQLYLPAVLAENTPVPEYPCRWAR